MKTNIFIRKCSRKMIFRFSCIGLNENASIKFYDFVSKDKCKALIEHSANVVLKENATYTLNGLLARCKTKRSLK